MHDSPDRGRLWLALAVALSAGALLAFRVDPRSLDWEPTLAATEPWRAVSAAFVHYSVMHLVANLLGAALVGALGRIARVPGRTVVAWLVAWPLTQLGLLLRPDLLHYGGLSGVLHAGVACVAWHLIVDGRGARRTIGALTLAGVVVKVLSESPWGAPLRHPQGWDIATAPFAHASGLVAGLLAAALCDLFSHRTPPPPGSPP